MALADIVSGNADKLVSDHLKCWIVQQDGAGLPKTAVVAVMGPGTTRSLQSNWNSPFENTNIGNIGRLERLAGIGQSITERTSITVFSSTQIWEGNKPISFNLNLQFYALRDAKKEVADALRALEVMAAPDMEDGSDKDAGEDRWWWGFSALTEEVISNIKPGGRIPRPVMLNIGPRMTIPNCIIENMSVDLGKERTKAGYPIRAEVQLAIATKTMLNREAVAKTWFK